MEKYHKIQTVFYRDPENNNKTLIEGKWSKPEFKLLKDIKWICTEKIDGVNIRIIWNGIKVRFKGKTDNAQLPPILIKSLEKIFTNEKMKSIFSDTPNVCLYGEGYGKKIQKGHNYISDHANFILFDIKIGEWWLERKNIENISQQLDVNIVPIIGEWSLYEAIEYVKKGFKSTIAQNENYDAEGLVCKPKIDLFDRKGERIITKIKQKDFKN